MALDPPRDLEPRYDVKGGSPRTPPGGVKMAEYQEYFPSHDNGYKVAVILGTILTFNLGLLIAMLVAWWTALQGHGVTQKDLEDYVDKHSPYLADKAVLVEHNRVQDETIGMVRGKQDRVIDRMGVLETIQKDEERDLAECKKEMRLVADYIEEQRKARK